MRVPSPVIKNRIGAAIRSNLNCPFTSIGHFGHNLTTVAGIEGGGTQRNHNAITWIISASLTSAGIEHARGTADRSWKTVFRAAIPRGPINDDTGKQDNSITAELIIVTKSISADESALGGGGPSY